LDLIIQDCYPPAADRHSMFLRGGKSRSQLSQSAGAHGSLYKLEVDKLLACILQWLRRRRSEATPTTSISSLAPVDNQHSATQDAHGSDDIPGPSNWIHRNGHDHENRQETFHGDEDTPPLNSVTGVAITLPTVEVSTEDQGSGRNEDVVFDEVDANVQSGKGEADYSSIDPPPQQKPCKLEFKDLQKQDMVDYASNVLLPEATYQLLLWRSGERRSHEPLSETEERRLHERGQHLAHQVDFVKSIERLREIKIKALNGKIAKEGSALQPKPPPEALGGTRSRPKLT